MSAASDTVRRRLDELLGPAAGQADAEPSAVAAGEAQAATSAEFSEAMGVPGAPRRRPRGPAGPQLARAWNLAREHMVAIAVVVLCGCAWTVFQLMAAKPLPVQATPPSAAATAPAVKAASPTPTPTPVLQVHVVGAVRSPGVVRVAAGARVHQAITAAGGTTHDAVLGDLNLAAPLNDGEQIVIGRGPGAKSEVRPLAGGSAGGASGSVSGAGGTAPGGKVNLNSATLAALDALPGVGPVTAQSIVSWREQHGRFSRVEELQEIDGIGPKTFEKLAPLVSV